MSAGIGYFSLREKFIFNSLTQNFNLSNSYKYINLPFSVGYRIINKNEFQMILSAGAIAGKLLSLNGKTISEEDISVIKNIEEVRKYYSYNYQGILKCKFVLLASNSIYLGIEPFYSMDLRSITRDLEPFVQQRNNLGISGNFIFVFK